MFNHGVQGPKIGKNEFRKMCILFFTIFVVYFCSDVRPPSCPSASVCPSSLLSVSFRSFVFRVVAGVQCGHALVQWGLTLVQCGCKDFSGLVRNSKEK